MGARFDEMWEITFRRIRSTLTWSQRASASAANPPQACRHYFTNPWPRIPRSRERRMWQQPAWPTTRSPLTRLPTTQSPTTTSIRTQRPFIIPRPVPRWNTTAWPQPPPLATAFASRLSPAHPWWDLR